MVRRLSGFGKRPSLGSSLARVPSPRGIISRRPLNTRKLGLSARRGGLMDVSFEVVKANFFDRKVLDRIDQAERRILGRIGAFIRRDARRSMRPAKTRRTPPSPPGKPPRSRKGQLKKFLFYWYDPVRHDVVVGPIRLPRTRYAIPGIHEHGGTIRTRRHVLNYPARPYMRPALAKNLRKGLQMYRNALRRRV